MSRFVWLQTKKFQPLNVHHGGIGVDHVQNSCFWERILGSSLCGWLPFQNKLDRAENYLTADLRPATSFDAALSSGHIPSNTQDVLAARYGR